MQHTSPVPVAVPPIEELWHNARFAPNPSQRAAILHTDGPLYLPAGPGSGKTRVLLWRTVNLIVYHQVEPKHIFLSTFTEKAAFQLKEGLRSLLAVVTNLTDVNYDLGEMYIGTIHSLCQRLIGDRSLSADRSARPRPPALLDELGQYFDLVEPQKWASLFESVFLDPETANQTLNSYFSVSSSSRHRAALNCIGFFNRLAEENIEPSEALGKLGSGSPARTQLLDMGISPENVGNLLQLAFAYNLRLRNERLTTFSLVQQHAFRQAEHLAHDSFSHIIIDEYQDTNPIQEMLLFKLAAARRNLCVVGDDDQALYRFRGATVENFVRFPAACERKFGVAPTIIPLDTNYRSRSPIVSFYKEFMGRCNWYGQNGDGPFRVLDKNITAHRVDPLPAVVSTAPTRPVDAFDEIAILVRALVDTGKVADPNQIAFLFPSLKWDGTMTPQVARMKDALESRGLRVYAPRANRFLEVAESTALFGLLLHIFGKPDRNLDIAGGEYARYHDWLGAIHGEASQFLSDDPSLARFVQIRRNEIAQIIADGRALRAVAEARGWQLTDPYNIELMKRALLDARGLSDHARRGLNSSYFETQVRRRFASNPFTLRNVLNRVTASDWSILDIFYQLMGFDHFRALFELAESGADEGPICNLSLISNYLGRFVDTYSPIFTASSLEENRFANRFFGGYLYALYRLGESEYENADDPFPKGRIPFLTIHQAKGLEFPVVVLANPRKAHHEPSLVEKMVRPFLVRETGEPLDRMSEFDTMRMFYVALSRPKNLLVLAHLHGPGQSIHPHIRALLDSHSSRIATFDPTTVPAAVIDDDALPGAYSYTGDFLAYIRCPRQYMIFRKYDFTPSGSETMMFGSLVHRTLDDLHNLLISQRNQSA